MKLSDRMTAMEKFLIELKLEDEMFLRAMEKFASRLELAEEEITKLKDKEND